MLRDHVAYNGPFGAYTGTSSDKTTRLIVNDGSATGILLYFRTNTSGWKFSTIAPDSDMTDNIIEGKISKSGFYLKNLTLNIERSSTVAFADTGDENATTMKLFGSGPNPPSTVTKSYSRIYYFDTYDNGVCIQKLVPAKRLSDNVLGLYDIITRTFLTNAGTGDFVAGPTLTITGTVYDSSGCVRNGTINGALTATVGSPRYDVATVFDGTNDIGPILPLVNQADGLMSEETISFWIYKTEDTTNKDYYIIRSGMSIRISSSSDYKERIMVTWAN
jgi:hypothetical protein